MDVSTLQTMITTLGFPIVCTVALAFFIWKIWKQNVAQNESREEKLYTVIGKAQEQNEQLSKTNAEFVTVLNTYREDLKEIKEDVTVIKQKLN